MVRKLQRGKSVDDLVPARGQAYMICDSDVSNLWIHVHVTGLKTFEMRARFGNARDPTRRKIGNASKMSIEEARKIALHWASLNRKGIDPQEEAFLADLEEERYRRQTFRNVMEDYIAYLPDRERNRRADKDAQLLRCEFLDPARVAFLDKPYREVRGAEIEVLIEAIRDRPAPRQAYNVFSMFKTFVNWTSSPKAIDAYGIPDITLTALIRTGMRLRRVDRERSHFSDEIRAYWAACEAMEGPVAEYFRTAMLTGQRKNDIRLATWAEIDLSTKLWTIPASRFKNGKPQYVPLSVPMVQLLERISAAQSGEHGPFVFSKTDGLKPIAGSSAEMKKFRKKFYELYTEAHPEKERPEHWVLHDLRRTVRSALSNLGVPEDVAEAVIGHVKKKLEKIYNQNTFKLQRRRALHLWAEELKYIIDDPTHSLEAEENEQPIWPSRWNGTALGGGSL